MASDRRGAAGGRDGAAQVGCEADRVATIHAAVTLAVIEQRLAPGTRLPEDQLAAHFSVSRTLVRDALRALAGEGMVVLARNRGAAVASPSPQDARDLFEARRVVEAVTVLRAAERGTAGDLATLDRLTEEARAALGAGDRGRAIRLSGEFHVALAGAARQPVLERFVAELVARSSLVVALYGHRGRSDCGDHDHRALVGALRARDGGRAARLMTEHLAAIEGDLDFARVAGPPRSLAALLGPARERGAR